MSWKTDQYMPAEDEIAGLLQGSIVPNLTWIREELGTVPVVKFSVWVNGDKGSDVVVGPEGIIARDDDRVCNGEARAYFRHTFKKERSLFQYEILFDNLSPRTGFTGILGRGEMKRQIDGKMLFRETTSTRVYNVREFRGAV